MSHYYREREQYAELTVRVIQPSIQSKLLCHNCGNTRFFSKKREFNQHILHSCECCGEEITTEK